MRTCRSCQARNSERSTFCIRCGATLSDPGRDPAGGTDAFAAAPLETPAALVDAAAAQLADGHAQAAADNCRRAIALEPRHVEAHVVLGMAQEQLGELEPALRAYETVLSLAPERPVERQKAALLRLRLGHMPPPPPPRTRREFSLAGCWAATRQLVASHPAIAAGVGAGLLMLVLLSVLLVSNSRAQARQVALERYESELQLARQAMAEQRYSEASAHYAAAWKLQSGDAAVQAEWTQAYQYAQYEAHRYQRELEIAQTPKYIANSTGRNPFEPVPIGGAPGAPATPGAAAAAPLPVPPPTLNPRVAGYDSVQGPPRPVPAPTTPSAPGFDHRQRPGSNPIITPVPQPTPKPTPSAELGTADAHRGGEITIWVDRKPASKPTAPSSGATARPDARSLRERGEQLAGQGRAEEAIADLERAAGAYDDLARTDPNNAAAHSQAAHSCRARIDVLRHNHR